MTLAPALLAFVLQLITCQDLARVGLSCCQNDVFLGSLTWFPIMDDQPRLEFSLEFHLNVVLIVL